MLNEHPAVREAAVVGVPDERLGAVRAAAIIFKDGAARPCIDAPTSWLEQRPIANQVPVYYRFVAVLPRTPSMKLSAPAVKALFAA